MGKTYAGNSSGVAKVPKKIYAGNGSNVAKAVKVVYCGNSSGKAVEVWRNSTLPSTYQKVEYIFNSGGTQYIDTGIVANSDTKSSLDVQFTGSDVPQFYFFGVEYTAPNEGTKDYCMLVSSNNPRKIYIYFGGGVTLDSNEEAVYVNTRYKFIFNDSGGKFYKNNKLLGTSTTTFSKPGNNIPLLLFGYNHVWGGTGGYNTTIAKEGLRVYRFQAWQSNVLIRDMYPCYLKSNTQTVGMYDLVNGQFYGNSGTGIFYKGPNID